MQVKMSCIHRTKIMKKILIVLILLIFPLMAQADLTGTEGLAIDLSSAGAGTDFTIAFDPTELDAVTWSDNANASNIWTFDVSGTNHTMTAGNGLMTFSHAVNIIGAATIGTATSVAGDLSLYDAGTLTIYEDGDNFNITLVCNSGEAVGTLTGGLDVTGLLEAQAGLTVATTTAFSLGANQIDNGSDLLDGEMIADNTIDVDSLDWGAFTDLGEGGAVTWGNIAEGELADSTVVSADIKDDTIDSDDYAGGSIDAEHLAADIIDETKIADNGIDSEHYNDDSIDNAHINFADFTDLGDGGVVVWGNIAEGEIADAVIVDADIKDDTIQEAALDCTAGPTDNYILSYDAGTGGFTWVVDATGGNTAYDDIGDPDAATTIDFDDDETVTWTVAEDSAGSFFTINDSDADLAANTYLLHLLYSVDDNQANADYFKCEDAGGVVFSIQQDGDTVSTGSVQGATLTDGTMSINAGSLTAVVGVDGSGTISANLFAPDAADGADIGTADLEFSDIYLADGSIIYGQNDQSNTITSSATDWTFALDITVSGGNINTGNIPLVVGDATTDTITFTTDGTGNAEIVLPNDSVGDAELDWANLTDLAAGGEVTWGNIAEGELADSTVVSADIKDDAIDSADYAAGSIDEEHLNVTNAPGEGEDNYVLTYNHAATNFTWAPDADSGGATAWDDIGDPDAAATVDFTTYTQTIDIGVTDDGGPKSGLILDVTGLGAGVTDVIALEITTATNNDEDYIPIAIYDDSGSGNDLIFKIDSYGSITLSGGGVISNTALYKINFADNSDSAYFNFGGTDIDIVWSDGALNLRNSEDTDAIVNIQGKDAGEKGILRVQSDGDDKYIELYNDDTDAVLTNSAGNIIINPVGLGVVIGDNGDEDYTLTFDGDTSDGVLTYDEDNADFEFDQDVATTGTVTATEFSGGGASLTSIDAATGDSATAFFDAGTIEHEWGGLQADISGYTGLVAITGADTTAEIDALDELEGQLADVTLIYTEAIIPAAGTDPDVDAVGEFSIDSDGANEPNDVVLRSIDGGNTPLQIAMCQQQKSFQATIITPNDLADATRDACPIWSNETGMSFVVTKIEAWSDTDDTTLNVEEEDGDGANNATIDAVEIATDGTGMYYTTETTITAATVEANHLILIDFDDTDDPGWVKISICGYFLSDVD